MSAQPVMSRSSFLPAVRNLPPWGQLIVQEVSWGEYERFLEELANDYHGQVNYMDGRLVVMSPLYRHEMYEHVLVQLAQIVADKFDLDFESAGSTTFKEESFRAGAEPDGCFYIQNAEHIIGKREIDLKIDPPPEVAIEIDISRVSDYKLDIYARLGMPELWRYDEKRVEILHLVKGKYVERPRSLSLPILTAEVLTRFLEQSKIEGQGPTRKAFRKWLKTAKA